MSVFRINSIIIRRISVRCKSLKCCSRAHPSGSAPGHNEQNTTHAETHHLRSDIASFLPAIPAFQPSST
eukprot:1511368-Rhodomonas_salina.1